MKRQLVCALGLGLVLAVSTAGMLLAQTPPGGTPAGKQDVCLSNIRQLALGCIMYAGDYYRFPRAEKWCDGIAPYIRNERIHHCPADKAKYSYAMNPNVGGKDLGKIADPGAVVLVFESTKGKKNAFDAGKSWPARARHPGGNCVAYVDGHAKCTKKKPDFRVALTREKTKKPRAGSGKP